MKKTACLLYLLGAGMSGAAPSLDLSPVPKSIAIESSHIRGVEFHSFTGSGTGVQYVPPWPMHGEGDRAFFEVPSPGASAEVVRMETEEPLDLSNDDAVTQWVKATVPKGAENAAVAGIEHNPVFLNGRPTVDIKLTYSLYGLPYTQSVVLAQRAGADPREVIRFQVATVHPEQFDKLHRELQRSLYSIMEF